MFRRVAMSVLLALFGVLPISYSVLSVASSSGEVLLRFLLLIVPSSELESWIGKVAGECEMNEKDFFFSAVCSSLVVSAGEDLSLNTPVGGPEGDELDKKEMGLAGVL